MSDQYMYLFVRRDLSAPQQIVQSSHAAAYIGHRYHGETSIVLCDVPDEAGLHKVSDYLAGHEIDHEKFFEPDIEAHTAIATQPLMGDKRRLLRKFSLMR